VPIIPYFKLAAIALSAIVGFGIGWKVNGWRHDAIGLARMEADQKAIEASVENAKKVQALREANTEKAAQLEIERERQAQTIVKEVIRDVIQYVQTPAASNCGIDPDGVRIINKAAGVPALPETSGTSDATAGAVVASVTDNYGTCTKNSNQLSALQDWIRAQR
jgi:hypothetical protein